MKSSSWKIGRQGSQTAEGQEENDQILWCGVWGVWAIDSYISGIRRLGFWEAVC